MSAPGEPVVDPVDPVVDEPVVDEPVVDEPVIDEGAPTPLDRALLEWLGFDVEEATAWWVGRESWPSPLRALLDDLVLRGVETIDDLTEHDQRRLRVADRVSEVQEGYRRRFVHGMPRRRPGGWSVARHHDERRVW